MILEKIFHNLINNFQYILKDNESKEKQNNKQNNKVNHKGCNIVQNYQILENNTPDNLQNLSYGIYPENFNYNNLRLNYKIIIQVQFFIHYVQMNYHILFLIWLNQIWNFP